MALRAKNGPDAGPPRTGLRPWGGDEAEPEGFGGSKVEGENEVWPVFLRNPSGRGQFSRFLRRSSLADTRYPPHGQRPVRGGPGMRHSSLLELEKTGARRHRPSSVNRPCELQDGLVLGDGLRSAEKGLTLTEASERLTSGPEGSIDIARSTDGVKAPIHQSRLASSGLPPAQIFQPPERSRSVDAAGFDRLAGIPLGWEIRHPGLPHMVIRRLSRP